MVTMTIHFHLLFSPLVVATNPVSLAFESILRPPSFSRTWTDGSWGFGWRMERGGWKSFKEVRNVWNFQSHKATYHRPRYFQNFPFFLARQIPHTWTSSNRNLWLAFSTFRQKSPLMTTSKAPPPGQRPTLSTPAAPPGASRPSSPPTGATWR